MASTLRHRVRRALATSPWLILASIVLGSFVLALVMLQIDHALQIDPSPSQPWLYGGTAESAISLLSAVASSSITVAGVVFSATFVTMQLASSQYTPRVIEPLSRRWYIQIVLGTFLGTFMYALVVLRAVRPAGQGDPEFVPVLSVTLCVLYALASVGLMLYYTSYAMRSLQPSFLIDSAARETVDVLRRRATRRRDLPHQEHVLSGIAPEDEPAVLRCRVPGFVQQIRVQPLLEIASRHDLTIRVDCAFGRYVLRGEPLLSVWPASRCTGAVISDLHGTVILGAERTAEQDVEYGIRRVADIMLKALSPAINDPTTAEYALNRLGELIVLLAASEEAPATLATADGRHGVIWRPERFDLCVQTAFGQLRFYIGTDVHLMLYSLDLLQRTTALVRPHLRGPLLLEASQLRSSIMESVRNPVDRAALDDACGWIDLPSPSGAGPGIDL